MPAAQGAPRGRGRRAAGDRRACRRRSRGSAQHRQRAVLRLGDRWRAAGLRRGRLADVGMGSERRRVRLLARGGGRRRRRRRLAQRASRRAATRVVRAGHRLPDGARHGVGRGAAPPVGRSRLVGRGTRPRRQRTDPRPGRRAPRDAAAGAAPARRRHRCRRPRAVAHRRDDRPRRVADRAGGRTGRADDRVARRRRPQSRRVRPVRRGVRAGQGAARLGARRRGVRDVGRGEPSAAAPGPRHRQGGLVGDRCAQVAERTLRQRDRVRRAPGRAQDVDVHPGRVQGRGRRRPRPVRVGARVVTTGPRHSALRGVACARSHRGSPRSSIAVAI